MNKRNCHITFIFIVITIVITYNYSYANDTLNPCYDLQEEYIYKFSIDLFEEGEYYRAITEAKRYISYFPQGKNVEDMYKLIGDSYLMSNEWSDAINAYDEFIGSFPNSPFINQIIFYKAICLVKKNDYKEAKRLFKQIVDSHSPLKKNESILWKISLLIQESNFEEIEKLLNDESIRQEIGQKIDIIKQTLSLKKKANYKSPVLAGIMSSILPGSGQFYNERYKDGIYSFILNALFILGAVKAYTDENYAVGGILTIFEAGWYTGNIYSALNGAQKFNRKINEDIFKISIGNFGLLENEVRRTPKISVIFRFPF